MIMYHRERRGPLRAARAHPRTLDETANANRASQRGAAVPRAVEPEDLQRGQQTSQVTSKKDHAL
jgi:hypothetical protein